MSPTSNCKASVLGKGKGGGVRWGERNALDGILWQVHSDCCFPRVSGTGGWSAKGCEVVFRNETHVSCQCNHMTSFAVLMDISRREVSKAGPHLCEMGKQSKAKERGLKSGMGYYWQGLGFCPPVSLMCP